MKLIKTKFFLILFLILIVFLIVNFPFLKKNVTENSIIGTWTVQDNFYESNIKITDNRIIYPENQNGYVYELVKPNIIKIYYTDWVFVGEYFVDNNTLTISDENGKQVYNKIVK